MRLSPPESSSNVVGSVRTGMARSRQAVTTFWRSMPGAEGIAMITSSGFDVVEHARQLVGGAEHLVAGHAHALLARVVVHEADRRAGAGPGCGAARRPPAGRRCRRPRSAPRGAARSRNGPRCGRSTSARTAKRAPLDEHQREQEVERDHRARRVVRPIENRNSTTIRPDARDDDRLEDRLEVLLVDEAPQLRVEPEQREDHELHRHGQHDRVGEQVLVALRDAAVEAQDVGQVVGERQQAASTPTWPTRRTFTEECRDFMGCVPRAAV